ncbi:MAG: alanine dehydrogenase [bacterium]|nr:alanine dehydrogenase [bacterium]
MTIGVLKEIKIEEYRVGLTPESVKSLVQDGHMIMVEKDAGSGSGFHDELYSQAGARIVDRFEIFNSADLIVKVKEPQMSEIELLKPGHIVFTFFHFASNPDMTIALARKKVTCIAYELIEDQGVRPILKPMSEIAGKLSIQQGMKYLEKPCGGKGILLMGTENVESGKVVILGGGVAGSCAAEIAYRIGAKVVIIEKNVNKREILKGKFPGAEILESNHDNIIESCRRADIVIGSVLVPGHRPPILLKRSDLEYLEKGTVLIDISIDEGGVFESSRPTTHKEPVFVESGVVHYCVPNMPGIVPKTSTIALNAASMPYVKIIAEYGENAGKFCEAIKKGCAILNGEILNQDVRETLELKG